MIQLEDLEAGLRIAGVVPGSEVAIIAVHRHGDDALELTYKGPDGQPHQRILARADTREMLDSLLMHVGTAYETEIWGRVRKFMVLDAINDLVGLAVRCSLLHRMVE